MAKAKSRKSRIDVSELKRAASGRWVEILTAVGNIPVDVLDGQHHPCPKCGGEDRFRAFNDGTGGAICNQCLSSSNGDGISVVQWAAGIDFRDAINRIAEHLGFELESKNGKAAKAKKSGPDKDLEWQPWSTALVKHYLAKKPGITEAALLAAGARLAKYKSFSVIAFPVAGKTLDANEPVGWVLVNCLGGIIPKLDRSGKVTGETKVKITYGSKAGLLGAGAVQKLKEGGEVEIVWKTEGLSDMLALMSIIPGALHGQHLVVSNSNGTNENPRWQADVLAANDVHVIHDADQPGQAGAAKWSQAIAAKQADDLITKNVRLPLEITATKGRDLRDWLAMGNTYDDLLELAGKSEIVEATELPDDESPVEVEARISNGFEIPGVSPEGEDQIEIVPMLLNDLVLLVDETTHGWPKRIGRSLFVIDGKIANWFEKSPSLFGWLQTYGRIDWYAKVGFVGKSEFFERLRSSVEEFVAIETLPHWPPLPKHYYIHREAVETDGSFLNKLVDFFRPSTTVDKQLIKAMFVSLFWGGPPGSRPAWVLTSDAGRGVGKSKLAQAASHLVNGHIDVSNNEDIESLKSRLLSAEGLSKRVALIDNAKSHKLSWAELEALVTATTISGKRLYVGEGSRPNSLTWIVTLNAPSLSTDLAQRSVIVKLDSGVNRPTWWEEVIGFIDQERDSIIADCIQFLRSPSPGQLAKYSRWAAWEESILSRLADPAEIQKLIAERQTSCDSDLDEAGLIEDYFGARLRGLGFDPERHSIRIPVAVVAQWYNFATGQRQRVQGATKRLKQYASEKQIHCLEPDRSRRHGRCFVWTGVHCDVSERTQNDLGHRLKEAKQREDGEDARGDD